MEKSKDLVYANLLVPVWKSATDNEYAYSGLVVRQEDLPADLREEFLKSQITAAMPFEDAHYVYDFTGFMDRGGKSWYHDGSAVAAKYLYGAAVMLQCSCCGGDALGRQ